ncbi:hypothetical protein L484_019256 [Morus notabilis]|uniref:Uncharacterized protein n=1 Tax=Morus notabilis TaxID=981085 RepID=W9QRD2_9ROSA|nr:hypothetical protein L484_019256 [Morus notabilis]
MLSVRQEGWRLPSGLWVQLVSVIECNHRRASAHTRIQRQRRQLDALSKPSGELELDLSSITKTELQELLKKIRNKPRERENRKGEENRFKKVNDIAELNEMKQKRIDKLEKMVWKEMKTMRKQMIRCRKELKDGETSTEAQDEEAGGSAELQEAPNKLVDASSFFLLSYLLIDNFVVGVWKEMKTMRKQMIRCRKELKDGETSTEAQDEEAGGSAELQEAPNKLVDASSFFLLMGCLFQGFVPSFEP